MAYPQGLIETAKEQNREIEEIFTNEKIDFFELYDRFHKVVADKQGLLLGMSHNFGMESPINTPTLNDLIDVWYEMKLWKQEIEDDRR